MGNGRRRKGSLRGRRERRETHVRETEGHNDEKEVRGSRGRVKYSGKGVCEGRKWRGGGEGWS
jgi:hypothetical protein